MTIYYMKVRYAERKGETMKKELDYFTIEGEFGGNQEWFTNVVMNIGGCGAATACDSCIYLGLYRGMKKLYPFDPYNLSKTDYKRFSQIMKPYIRPRAGGVKKLEWYMEGLERYINDANRKNNTDYRVSMEPFSGENTYDDAAAAIKRQIDKELPVPYLMLRHKDQKFKDFIWHWFLVIGYEEIENDILITAATYGEAVKISLRELWDTGHIEKGGIVLYEG